MKITTRTLLILLVPIFIVTACKKDKNPSGEKEAQTEPVAQKPKTDLDRYIADLDSDEFAKRKEARDAIMLKGHGAVVPLLDAFEGGSPVLQRNALDLLDRLNPNWVDNEKAVVTVPVLIQMLLDPTDVVSGRAKKTLIVIGDPAMDELVYTMLGDDILLANLIAPILMEIDIYWIRSERGKLAIPEFIKALKSKNKKVMQNATNTVVKMGHEAYDHLMAELLDEDRGYRKRIKWILQTTDENWAKDKAALSAVPGFIDALKNNNKGIRLAAVEVLANIEDDRAFLPLVEALDDDFYYVSKKAEKILMSMTGENYGKDKELWRVWWNEYQNTIDKLEKEISAQKEEMNSPKEKK